MSNVRRKSRQAPLTRDRILDAAVALADEGGIESISMRKLGLALGVEAMSLYNHVANKDAVLTGLADRVASQFELPAEDEPWDAALRRSALTARAALKRHPWAATLMLSAAWAVSSRLAYMDAQLRCLRRAGFSADEVYHAYHVLDGHIFGFSLWLEAHELPDSVEDLPALAEEFMRRFPLDDYPDVLEHARMHLAEGPHQDYSAFELGLDLILDGLRKMRASAPRPE